MTAVNLDHELLRRAVAQPEVLHWQTWAALAPGPSLLVLGAAGLILIFLAKALASAISIGSAPISTTRASPTGRMGAGAVTATVDCRSRGRSRAVPRPARWTPPG